MPVRGRAKVVLWGAPPVAESQHIENGRKGATDYVIMISSICK